MFLEVAGIPTDLLAEILAEPIAKTADDCLQAGRAVASGPQSTFDFF